MNLILYVFFILIQSYNGGKTVTNKYDAFNQVIEATDEYGRTSKTEYDKYG